MWKEGQINYHLFYDLKKEDSIVYVRIDHEIFLKWLILVWRLLDVFVVLTYLKQTFVSKFLIFICIWFSEQNSSSLNIVLC